MEIWVNRGAEFKFFRDIYIRYDMRVDIFTSIKTQSMISKFGRQTHLKELAHVRLKRQVLVTSRDITIKSRDFEKML